MDWLQAVSSVGFPIVSFFVAIAALKYSFDKSNTMFMDSLEKVGNLTEAVNNNTVVLTELVKKLDGSDDIK